LERARLIAGVALVLVIAAVLILVIVRNAGQQVDEPTTAGTTAPAEQDESEPTPDPAPEENEEPVAVPTPDTTGRDFDHIFREIVAFRDWLFANPDPELVGLIYHPDCECRENLRDQLQTLVDNGLRFSDEGFEVTTVEVIEDLESVVRIQTGLERTPQVLIDEAGRVVDESDGVAEQILNVILVRDSQRWRVMSLEDMP
jgi:hypothetical protein